MAKVISDLDDAIDFINTLYESDSTAPSEGEEDYAVWTALLNIAINIWENEEGMLWRELFVKLADASDGDKTTSSGDTSYAVPSDFRFSASGYVWIGSGTNKIAYKAIDQKDVQLYENNKEKWCYFLMDGSPTLEFNPNISEDIPYSYTISYNYYKTADKVSTGTDTFDMGDPMFAVYFAVAELKREEGDVSAAEIATQKLEAMKTKNMQIPWNQADTITNVVDVGFGV